MISRKHSIIHIGDLTVDMAPSGRRQLDYRLWIDLLCEDIRRHVVADAANSRFVVFSGDLTLSAQESEFVIALDTVRRIAAAAEIEPNRVVVIPGNHDRVQPPTGDLQLSRFTEFTARLYCPACSHDGYVQTYPADRIAFIAFDSAASQEIRGRISTKSLKQARRELQNLDLHDYLLVAVLHHNPDPLTAGHHDLSNAMEFQTFLWEWTIQLVLHGGVSFPSWTVRESPYGRQIFVGAGGPPPENWRATLQPRQYQMIHVLEGDSLLLDTRSFESQSSRWISQSVRPYNLALAPSHREAPSVVPISHVKRPRPSTSRESIMNSISELSQHDLTDLVSTLDPSIPPYDPFSESKGDLARRLVAYFDCQDALSTLEEEVKRITGHGDYAQMRVFVSATPRDSVLARELANLLRQLGHKAILWEDEAKPGESISHFSEKQFRTADAVILLVSDYAVNSGWIQRTIDFGFGRMPHGTAKTIPVVITDKEIPDALGGLHYVDMRNDQSELKWRLSQALAGIARAAPHDRP